MLRIANTKNNILLLVLSLINVSLLNAQWQPDFRLTNDPASSICFGQNKSISLSGSYIYFVWQDNRDGNMEIYCKRSLDEGLTWGQDTRLTNSPYFSEGPVISANNLIDHLIWSDERDGNYEIYYKKSVDRGVTWGLDTRLTFNTADSWFPDMAADGTTLHIVWDDKRDGLWQVYYKRSADGGITWTGDTKLSNSTAYDNKYPEIVFSGLAIHVFWTDTRDGNSEIYYKRSIDGGVTWGADTRLTNNPGYSTAANSFAWGSDLRLVWEDDRDGNLETYYKRSVDGGLNWGPDTRLTNSALESISPSISVLANFVNIVWEDYRNGNPEIYYKQSMDYGVTWSADTRLTNNAANSELPSIASNNYCIHVTWMDARDGNSEIYYKRNPLGNPLSITNINSENPNRFDLSQNYPNPFNPVTSIRYQVAGSGPVILKVYDILGKVAAVLVNEKQNPGTYEVQLDAGRMASGVYFYRLEAGEYTETRKMVLVK